MSNLGLLGYPVERSVSPQIHGFFLTKNGINGGYVTFPVKEADELPILMHFLERFRFTGLNITTPHKNAILSHVALADDTVRRIGAANTLHWRKDGWHAFNTDVHGFSRQLELCDIDVLGKDILLIGAGGAAAAVMSVLQERGVKKVSIVNRSENRVKRLVKNFGEVNVDYFKFEDLNRSLNFDIVINSTCVDWSNDVWRNRFWSNHGKIFGGNRPQTVIDLQYKARNCASSAFLDLWEGSDRHDGFIMLAEQAAKAFEIWFGIYPQYDVRDLRALIYGK